jgi:hypothetical protein
VEVVYRLPLSRSRHWSDTSKELSSKRVNDINNTFQTSIVCFVFGLRSGVSGLSDLLSGSFPATWMSETSNCCKNKIKSRLDYISTMIGCPDRIINLSCLEII